MHTYLQDRHEENNYCCHFYYHSLCLTEKAQSKAEADDILALFNQATRADSPDIDALLQQKQSEKVVDGRK